MKRMTQLTLLTIVTVGVVWVVDAAQKPQPGPTPAPAANPLPGRAPVHSHYLKAPDFWRVYYDVLPEAEQDATWTLSRVKPLVEANLAMIQQINEMEKRIKALEAKLKPPAATTAEPNGVKGDVK